MEPRMELAAGAVPADSPHGPAALAADALPRRLGLAATSALVIGTIIGSGIFRVPAAVATEVGSPSGVMIVWVLGALISLCGALALAELASAFPSSGGVFVYLREVYGNAVAFLFGWTILIVGPGSIAGVSLIFAEYFARLVPLSDTGARGIAAMLVVAVSIGAYRSVHGLGTVMTAATGTKVAALTALVITAVVLGDGSAGSFGAGAPAGAVRWGGAGMALIAALWAYNGFQDMVSAAGEVKDPGRTLPRALIAGMLVVVAVYLGANAAYLYVVPFETIRQSPVIASETMVRLLGDPGARLVAVMVMVSTFGAVVGVTFANPRVYYAMARAGLLFSPLARVHSRHRTPHVAVVAQGILAFIAVWSRTFEQLAAAFVLGIWPFLALCAAGVIVLRRTRPELVRPYRTPAYPVVPLVFIAGTAWIVIAALVSQPGSTLAGAGLTLLGVPIYLWGRRFLAVADRAGNT